MWCQWAPQLNAKHVSRKQMRAVSAKKPVSWMLGIPLLTMSAYVAYLIVNHTIALRHYFLEHRPWRAVGPFPLFEVVISCFGGALALRRVRDQRRGPG